MPPIEPPDILVFSLCSATADELAEAVAVSEDVVTTLESDVSDNERGRELVGVAAARS